MSLRADSELGLVSRKSVSSDLPIDEDEDDEVLYCGAFIYPDNFIP